MTYDQNGCIKQGRICLELGFCCPGHLAGKQLALKIIIF
jgi:hypothetical protein